MTNRFTDNTPIYTQIMEQVKIAIAMGTYAPGSKIPSVRDLAVQFGVNPNTIQKSLTKLEEQGYLYTENTAGRFVTADAGLIEQLRRHLPNQLISDFLQEMNSFGIHPHECIQLLQDYIDQHADTNHGES